MSTRKFFVIYVVIAAVIVLGALAAKAYGANASPKPPGMRLAPPVDCKSSNRMDIFVDEDNILWECVCEMLMKPPPLCRWQVIGGVDPVAETRIRAKIAAGKLPKRFYYSARYRYIVRLYTRTAR
jgi:hypothetical protein